ncbi:hypothetical protein JCM17823_01180 [Halorubrum gandharaense]
MLDATLSAAPTADGDAVDLALTVTNAGADPVSLSFRTGQRADFVARAVGDGGGGGRGDGTAGTAGTDTDPVWRYGEGRMFTQVLGSETLDPGESTTYIATWSNPPAGAYEVEGELAASDADVSATATVEVGE